MTARAPFTQEQIKRALKAAQAVYPDRGVRILPNGVVDILPPNAGGEESVVTDFDKADLKL